MASNKSGTQNLNVRYFFVTDIIKNADMQVAFGPTTKMLAVYIQSSTICYDGVEGHTLWNG